jgi:hypothetical protein
MAEADVRRWLELAEARAYADTYRAAAATPGDSLGARVVDGDDGAAFWLEALDFGFFNRCVGLGIVRPATEGVLDAAITAYRSAGRTQFALQVSPFAVPGQLETWLVGRRFQPSGRWAKLWRATTDAPEPGVDLRIEQIDATRRADYEAVVLAAFGMPAVLGTLVSATIGLPGWLHYLSFDADRPVGAAAARIEGSVAWLGYGATLESHRGRGSQSSLLARRLRDAASLGAGIAVTETGEDTPDAPNPSFRNMIRTGFTLSYLRRNWVAAPAEGSPAA